METYHRPVMLEEVISGLALRPGGVYFDGTVGGGGHSFAILEREPTARLIATDKDPDALRAAADRFGPFGGRFALFHEDYKNYESVLCREGVDRLDGVLLDFGISSHQIDDERRGFSYRKAAAPLDMRMDTGQALSAETVVNGYSAEELFRILREYGEEPFAAPIVRAIVREREKAPIRTCGQLASLVEESIPARFRSPACARRTFQAVRIEVNGELEGLGECVRGLTLRLRPGGRICVLTFHSLEDRIVKNVFAQLEADCVCPKNLPMCVCGKRREAMPVNRKPIIASEEEKRQNPRSTCAKLRIAERVSE